MIKERQIYMIAERRKNGLGFEEKKKMNSVWGSLNLIGL